MERLDQCHLRALQEPLGRESNLGRLGERSSKELFEQLVLLLYGTSTILLIAMVFKTKNIKRQVKVLNEDAVLVNNSKKSFRISKTDLKFWLCDLQKKL